MKSTTSSKRGLDGRTRPQDCPGLHVPPSPSPGPSANAGETAKANTSVSNTDLNFLIEHPSSVRHAEMIIHDKSAYFRTFEERGDYEGLRRALGLNYPEPQTEDADLFYWCAVAHMRGGNILQAKSLFHRAKASYRDSDSKASCNSRLGMCFWREGKLDEALVSLVASLGLASEPATFAIIHINMGIVLAVKGDLNGSLRHCEAAHTYARQVRSSYLNGLFNLRLGNAYHRLESYAEAIGAYGLALPCFEECEHLSYQSLTLNNLAHAYLMLEEMDNAVSNIKRASELASLSDPQLLKRINETSMEIITGLAARVEAQKI